MWLINWRAVISSSVGMGMLFATSIGAANNRPFWENLEYAETHTKTRVNIRTESSLPANAPFAWMDEQSDTANEACHNKNISTLTANCIHLDQFTRKGLLTQIRYLNQHGSGIRKVADYSGLSQQSLLNTAQAALNWLDGYSPELSQDFELYPVSTNSAKVKFTGYFTPYISARHSPNHEYRYPIYRKPESATYPTRAQVFKGALRGRGLEIAWTNNPIDLYVAQIQGSGTLAFDDGTVVKMHFAANTDAQFVSVAQYMKKQGYIKQASEKAMRAWLEKHPNKVESVLAKNPRYVFFQLGEYERVTASGTPIIDGHSVAVDTNYIPFGSILLAEIPIRNKKGKVLRKEWRLLFAQDRGAAIRTDMRLDVYTGSGDEARLQANQITGVGKAYLLLKKEGRPFYRTASY